MPEETQQAATTAPQEKPKQPSLSEVIRESIKESGKAVNALVGAGAIAGTYFIGGINTLVVASAFPTGEKISRGLIGKELPSADFRDQGFLGALFAPINYAGITAVKELPKAIGLDSIVTNLFGYSVPLTSSLVAGALTAGVLGPAFVGIYYPLEYLITKKTFKGMWAYTKKKFYTGLMDTIPLNIFAGAAVATTYVFPALAPLLFPAFAIGTIIYKMKLAKTEGKIDYKRAFYPSTYLPTNLTKALNPAYLVSGTLSYTYRAGKNLLESAYAFADSVFNGLSNLFRKPQPVAPARPPAPARTPALAPQPA